MLRRPPTRIELKDKDVKAYQEMREAERKEREAAANHKEAKLAQAVGGVTQMPMPAASQQQQQQQQHQQVRQRVGLDALE
jgi:hypothetical protein